jgi:hypothetical protein
MLLSSLRICCLLASNWQERNSFCSWDLRVNHKSPSVFSFLHLSALTAGFPIFCLCVLCCSRFVFRRRPFNLVPLPPHFVIRRCASLQFAVVDCGKQREALLVDHHFLMERSLGASLASSEIAGRGKSYIRMQACKGHHRPGSATIAWNQLASWAVDLSSILCFVWHGLLLSGYLTPSLFTTLEIDGFSNRCLLQVEEVWGTKAFWSGGSWTGENCVLSDISTVCRW